MLFRDYTDFSQTSNAWPASPVQRLVPAVWGLRKLFGLKPATGISFQLLTLGVLYRFCAAIQKFPSSHFMKNVV